jgi:hypothetical protein
MTAAVELRDEEGRVLDRLVGEGDELARAFPAPDVDRFPYLRYVDPYGDTYFSRVQMTAVVPELERLVSESGSSIVAKVLELAHRCRGTPHTHLVFVGD